MSTDKRMVRKVQRQSIRVAPQDLEIADALIEKLADTREATISGGHWGRSAVLRWAVSEGLKVLIEKGGTT